MKILINDQMIEIFEGARLQDAVRKYSETELKLIEKEDRKIVDREGNILALDGELSDGEYFYIIEC
jgi:sulfur carrier protein ThiS